MNEYALCIKSFIVIMFYYSIYSGHHSLLVPPSEVEANPAVWLSAVSLYKGNTNRTFT